MAGEINKRIKEIEDATKNDKLAQEAYKYFRSITPIRSGNARRSTNLYQNSIEANYPYAQRLDQGYSKQAPNGMVKPTEEFVRQYLQKVAKGK